MLTKEKIDEKRTEFSKAREMLTGSKIPFQIEYLEHINSLEKAYDREYQKAECREEKKVGSKILKESRKMFGVQMW